MKIPDEYMEQAKRADTFLEDALETAEKRFERAIKNLQQRTIELAARLEQLPDGTMKGGRFALSQALALEPQLQQLFEDTYGRAVAEQVKDFAKVVGIIRDQFQPMGLSESFLTGPTKDMVQALAAQTDAALVGLGELARNQVAQAVYDSVLAGKPFSSLVDEIMNALTGLEDKAGRPLARYAKTFAQDALMEVYGRVHKMGADRAGMTHYLYFGTTVRDTRPFCAARVGKVFTREEVEGWEALTWRGKKPGSIWATRGGYNCRHQLLGVMPEWVDGDLREHLGIEEVQQPVEKPEPRKKPGKKPASMSNDDNLAKYVVVE